MRHADYEANLVPQALPGEIDMPAIVGLLKKHLPDDAVLTNGAGNFASWVHRFFKHHGLAKGHKTQLAPTVGSMGYGVPAGIAANIVTGRTVLTMAGDGDFLMNGQELATACSTAPRPSSCCLTTACTEPSACIRSATIRGTSAARSWSTRISWRLHGLWLCGRPRHAHGAVRAGAAGCAGAKAGDIDRGDAGPGGDHDAGHAERDYRKPHEEEVIRRG
jgi:hypothetical protein